MLAIGIYLSEKLAVLGMFFFFHLFPGNYIRNIAMRFIFWICKDLTKRKTDSMMTAFFVLAFTWTAYICSGWVWAYMVDITAIWKVKSALRRCSFISVQTKTFWWDIQNIVFIVLEESLVLRNVKLLVASV